MVFTQPMNAKRKQELFKPELLEPINQTVQMFSATHMKIQKGNK